jgi:hypothetical protein
MVLPLEDVAHAEVRDQSSTVKVAFQIAAIHLQLLPPLKSAPSLWQRELPSQDEVSPSRLSADLRARAQY